MEIAGVFFQQRQGNMFEGGLVGGGQDHNGCGPGLVGFFPAQRAQTPTVSGLESGKAKLRPGCAQVVTLCLGEGQKFFGDLGTHGMQADIFPAGIAAAVPIKTDRSVIEEFTYVCSVPCKMQAVCDVCGVSSFSVF